MPSKHAQYIARPTHLSNSSAEEHVVTAGRHVFALRSHDSGYEIPCVVKKLGLMRPAYF